MPDQFNQIRDRVKAGRIILVIGDITEANFGIREGMLTEMKQTVTSIIHAAANISFRAPLLKVVVDNCLPAVRLAEMASKFTNMRHFTQISSAFANSFLPDGPIEEKIYLLTDSDECEQELAEILITGTTRHLQRFPWAYAYSKHLMERLLSTRFPHLPLLLLRPTSIGPAIAQPYKLYGPEGSCPISTLYGRLMKPAGGRSVWHSADGSNILDEIPVDLVANIVLQHIHAGTRGVVHASASSYVPKSLEWILDQPFKYAPKAWVAKMAKVQFVQDHTVEQCKEAQFYQIGSCAWEFHADLSKRLKTLQGPLVYGMEGHDVDCFAEQRVNLIFQELFGSEELQTTGERARL